MNEIMGEAKEFYQSEFSSVSLQKKTLSGKEFDHCYFDACDFSESNINYCKFVDCKFIKCNLTALTVANCSFSCVEFEDCKMMGIDWTKADWSGLQLGMPLKFRECMIDLSSFYGLDQSNIVIDRCHAHDVDFREAKLSRADFSQSELNNSLFNNTNLAEANFYEATNYDIDINNNTVKGAKFCRYEAVRLLESIGIELLD